MCDGKSYVTERDTTPETRLASLLNKDLGTATTPREIRMFVRANWKLVCAYAHAIHDTAEQGD